MEARRLYWRRRPPKILRKTYGEFRISRPTSINVSNPAFEIKRCVLYFVLSDFAPPPNKIKTNGLYLVLCRGGGYQENDFLIVSDGFAHGFSPPLCVPGGPHAREAEGTLRAPRRTCVGHSPIIRANSLGTRDPKPYIQRGAQRF